jgi:hypothetical protein
MKTIVHVNQHVIRSNTKTGEREPALTVKTYKSNTYANEVQINGPSKVVYSPDKPLSCGARVWILIQICNRNYRTTDLQIKQWIDREASSLGILIQKIPRVELEDPCTEVFPRVTKKVKVARKWTPEQREAARLRMKAQWEAGVIKNRHLEKALEGAYDD